MGQKVVRVTVSNDNETAFASLDFDHTKDAEKYIKSTDAKLQSVKKTDK